jgi:hypothetical protein
LILIFTGRASSCCTSSGVHSEKNFSTFQRVSKSHPHEKNHLVVTSNAGIRKEQAFVAILLNSLQEIFVITDRSKRNID